MALSEIWYEKLGLYNEFFCTQTKHILHFGPRALELRQVSEELKGRIQEVRRI